MDRSGPTWGNLKPTYLDNLADLQRGCNHLISCLSSAAHDLGTNPAQLMHAQAQPCFISPRRPAPTPQCLFPLLGSRQGLTDHSIVSYWCTTKIWTSTGPYGSPRAPGALSGPHGRQSWCSQCSIASIMVLATLLSHGALLLTLRQSNSQFLRKTAVKARWIHNIAKLGPPPEMPWRYTMWCPHGPVRTGTGQEKSKSIPPNRQV